MRILIVQDDESIINSTQSCLSELSAVIDLTRSIDEAKDMLHLYEYQLILSDVVFKNSDGYKFLESLKSLDERVPVIITSKINSPLDKIKALNYGADDFISIPYDDGEFLARVKAVVRRSRGVLNNIIEVGELSINLDDHVTTINGKAIHLTVKEQAIIEMLASRKGKVITKEQFLNNLYSGLDDPEQKIIDVFICKLRNKIKRLTNKVYIETSWGRGYYIKLS